MPWSPPDGPAVAVRDDPEPRSRLVQRADRRDSDQRPLSPFSVGASSTIATSKSPSDVIISSAPRPSSTSSTSYRSRAALGPPIGSWGAHRSPGSVVPRSLHVPRHRDPAAPGTHFGGPDEPAGGPSRPPRRILTGSRTSGRPGDGRSEVFPPPSATNHRDDLRHVEVALRGRRDGGARPFGSGPGADRPDRRPPGDAGAVPRAAVLDPAPRRPPAEPARRQGRLQAGAPPEEISVLEVVQALDGKVGQEADEAGGIWLDGVEALRGVFSSTTIADIAAARRPRRGRRLPHLRGGRAGPRSRMNRSHGGRRTPRHP